METGNFRTFNHVSSLLNSRLLCYVLTLVHVGGCDNRSWHPPDTSKASVNKSCRDSLSFITSEKKHTHTHTEIVVDTSSQRSSSQAS